MELLRIYVESSLFTGRYAGRRMHDICFMPCLVEAFGFDRYSILLMDRTAQGICWYRLLARKHWKILSPGGPTHIFRKSAVTSVRPSLLLRTAAV